jgi:hypothetical protein
VCVSSSKFLNFSHNNSVSFFFSEFLSSVSQLVTKKEDASFFYFARLPSTYTPHVRVLLISGRHEEKGEEKINNTSCFFAVFSLFLFFYWKNKFLAHYHNFEFICCFGLYLSLSRSPKFRLPHQSTNQLNGIPEKALTKHNKKIVV